MSPEQQAIDSLIEAYVAAFKQHPDNVTGMVIRSSVGRVMDGENFRWVQDGQWRKLEWSWAGWDEMEATPQ